MLGLLAWGNLKRAGGHFAESRVLFYHPIPLDLLSVEEARDLLARRLGSHRVAAEPDAVDELITACARLPLALAIVAFLMAVGGPSLSTWLKNTQIRNAAESIKNGLVFAQMEAMRRNTPVRFQLIALTGFSTAANSAVPHNALHDARALRDHLTALD